MCQALCFVDWISFISSSWLRLFTELGKEQKGSSTIPLFMFKRGKYVLKSLIKIKGISKDKKYL